MKEKPEPGVVERYLSAIVAHDWDALARCLAPEVVRVGPYGDTYRGRDAYVAFLAGVMGELSGYSMEVTRIASSGSVVVAELAETVIADGAPLRTPEALVFDLDEHGCIVKVAVYLGAGESLNRGGAAPTR